MKDKIRENNKAIILILGIMLTIIGVTYSYLAPLINGLETESTISFGSGMIKITYNGSNVITGENIIPGWSATKEFTVVGYNNTSVTEEGIMDYAIKLVVEENTFTDGAIRFELTGTSTNENDTLSPLFGKVSTGAGKTLLGTARFSQDDNIKNDVTHTYSLLISFPNNPNENQSNDWGKNFSAYVAIEQGNLQIMLASEYIEKVYTDSFDGMNYLRYDGTEDNNLRYFGSGTNTDDVPNYISFNNELWRIIGVFDTYNAKTRKTEKSLKIIRNNYLGTASNLANVTDKSHAGYSWDTSASNINIGYGVNAWNDADLMYELNGDYLNPNLEENTYWYNGENNKKTGEYDRTQSISYEYQQYIMDARWTLGGWNDIDVTAADMYRYERNGEGSKKTIPGTTCSGERCNDTVVREDYWDGKIGLPYPSDFKFAAINNGTSNCYDKHGSYCTSTYNWMSNDISYWDGELTMTQFIGQQYKGEFSSLVYSWDLRLSNTAALDAFAVRPTLYLSTDTKIIDGNGTSSNPYTISL